MAEILTPGEKVSLERARDLVKRRQAVGCLDAAILVGAVDALVKRLEGSVRPGVRLPNPPPTMSVHASSIAASEMSGVPLDQMVNFVLLVASKTPERPGYTGINVVTPGSDRQAHRIVQLAEADLRMIVTPQAVPDGG